jgi:hypothetical protein
MNYNDRINQQFGRIYRIHGNRMKNVRISQIGSVCLQENETVFLVLKCTLKNNYSKLSLLDPTTM